MPRIAEWRRSVENLALVEKKPGAASARTKTEADDGERSGSVGARDCRDGMSGSATLPVTAASATAPRIARRSRTRAARARHEDARPPCAPQTCREEVSTAIRNSPPAVIENSSPPGSLRGLGGADEAGLSFSLSRYELPRMSMVIA